MMGLRLLILLSVCIVFSELVVLRYLLIGLSGRVFMLVLLLWRFVLILVAYFGWVYFGGGCWTVVGFAVSCVGFADLFVWLIGFAGVRWDCGGLYDLVRVSALHSLCVYLYLKRLCFEVGGDSIYVCFP